MSTMNTINSLFALRRGICAFFMVVFSVIFCHCTLDDPALAELQQSAVDNVPVITISAHPTNRNATVGNANTTLTISAHVTKNAALKYQWYNKTSVSNSDGTAIKGANGTDYTIPATLATGLYYYFCEVSASKGAKPVRSSTATVTISPPGVPVISISTQPTNRNFNYGNISGSLTVTASVTQGATRSYQWYSNTANSNTGGTIISGATGSSYSIPTTLNGGTYYYYCVVSATGGAASLRSNVAVITISPPVISISAHPSNRNFNYGNISGSLSVTASATLGVSCNYQWYSNTANSNTSGTIIGGATGSSYSIPTTLMPGTYYYFCVVSATGGAAAVRSNVATVSISTLTPTIEITAQPAETMNVTSGIINDSLSVSAAITQGAASLSYQWYRFTDYWYYYNGWYSGEEISGATEATYTLPLTLDEGTYYYYCVVSATGGAEPVYSDFAVVNVDKNPVVTGISVTTAGYVTTVIPGNTLQLYASVDAVNGASTNVTWTIISSGHSEGTNISGSGLLSIAANESQTAIDVKAASDEPGFADVNGTKTITVALTNTVHVVFKGPDREVIIDADTYNISVSSGDSLVVTVDGDFDYYWWALDGDNRYEGLPETSVNQLTISSGFMKEFSETTYGKLLYGNYTLTVMCWKGDPLNGGVPYSKELLFRVTE